jgi:hypothetical protein
VGLLLTGGGADGVRGLVCVKFHHGLSLIRNPTEAVNPSMSVRALRDDHVDLITQPEGYPITPLRPCLREFHRLQGIMIPRIRSFMTFVHAA